MESGKNPISEISNENLASSITAAPTTTSISPSHSENLLRRDHESVDDFEHLDPESSPVKEIVTEPVNLIKDTEPEKKMSGFSEEVNSLLVADPGPVSSSAGVTEQQNLLDMEFEETAAVSKIMESKNIFDDDDILIKTDKESDKLEPLLTAPSSKLSELNRAVTEPVFPPSHLDDNADEFEAVRGENDMSDKIQFESGIDLSDLMVNDKTDDQENIEEDEDEKSEEHLPKAKEELEAVYRSEPKHSTLTVDEPEEAQLSDREDDNAFVMAEKEDEVEEEEEIVPEPEPEVYIPPVTLPEVTPQPEVTKTKPVTPPAQDTGDDEIAACDVLGICK